MQVQLWRRVEHNKGRDNFRKFSCSQVPELLMEPSKELTTKLWWGLNYPKCPEMVKAALVLSLAVMQGCSSMNSTVTAHQLRLHLLLSEHPDQSCQVRAASLSTQPTAPVPKFHPPAVFSTALPACSTHSLPALPEPGTVRFSPRWEVNQALQIEAQWG